MQLLLVAGPLFTLNWSFLNWFGYDAHAARDRVELGIWNYAIMAGPKEEVEFRIRAIVSTVALSALLIHETLEYYIPRRNLDLFRKEYLGQQVTEWRKQLSPDIRINLMFAGRGLGPIRFKWVWNDGFRPHHADANMLIGIRQGVCGRAFKTKRPQSAYFLEPTSRPLTFAERWLFRNKFRLWGYQITRTQHLKGVISIPIIQTSAGLSTSAQQLANPPQFPVLKK